MLSDDKQIQQLKVALERELGIEYTDIELRRVGLLIIRFVFAKELRKLQ